MIDLRSDTVTLPSPAMRAAMHCAELGDDVYGEDPTVNRLETLAAELLGKEAALLVVSGTMGNLTALLAHCTRGQRVILGSESHIYNYEAGGASALGGLVYHPILNAPDGTLAPTTLASALERVNDAHFTQPGLVCLENTHNRCGGVVLSPAYMATVAEQAHAAAVPVHLDGARIFNAAVALGVDVRTFTQHADSIQFCLSKGLAAPVGSLIVGTRTFIDRAHRFRKMLGGGMRQAGVLAAAGIVALTDMVPRLAEDHANARRFATEIATIPGIQLDPTTVQTDIVIFELVDPRFKSDQLLAALRDQGILLGGMGGRRIRAVTHYGITADDVQAAVAAVRTVLA